MIVDLVDLSTLPDSPLRMVSGSIEEISKRYPNKRVFHFQKGKWNLILVEK